MNLRPYQHQAADAVLAAWDDPATASALIVMPTGTGKTVVFGEIIRRRHQAGFGRALVIAHRDILIHQAARQIKAVSGMPVDIEMAEYKARHDLWGKAPVVVSTVQTQTACGGNRMKRFDPHEYDTLIFDECHRSLAPTWRTVACYYQQNPKLKILGVTATPDRGDKRALGMMFSHCAYHYQLDQAVNDGWLVPIKQRFIPVFGLDYSALHTVAGDFNSAELATIMTDEEMCHKLVDPAYKLSIGKRVLVFCVDINHANKTAEIFNRHEQGCAAAISEKTPKTSRRTILAAFAAGSPRVLVNVGICTEGFDVPDVDVVVMARATKSRCLYAQMAGRGTRPLAAIAEQLNYANDPAERRALITLSSKPYVEIMDYVGVTGRHQLITTADILGGKHGEATIRRAKKKMQDDEEPREVAAVLDETEAELQEEKRQKALAAEHARKARLIVPARYQETALTDALAGHATQPERASGVVRGKRPTEKMIAFLEKNGINASRMNFWEARRAIVEAKKVCSPRQAGILRRYGYSTNLSYDQAHAIIDRIAANGWRRPQEATA